MEFGKNVNGFHRGLYILYMAVKTTNEFIVTT